MATVEEEVRVEAIRLVVIFPATRTQQHDNTIPCPPLDIPPLDLVLLASLLAWRMRKPEKVWARRSRQEGKYI